MAQRVTRRTAAAASAMPSPWASPPPTHGLPPPPRVPAVGVGEMAFPLYSIVTASGDKHSINLITPEILERCRAGARTSRFIITGFILVAAMIATATHSRLVVESAESRHEMVTGRADRALVLEANVNEVKDQIEQSLKNKKFFQERRKLLENLRKEAKIEKRLELPTAAKSPKKKPMVINNNKDLKLVPTKALATPPPASKPAAKPASK